MDFLGRLGRGMYAAGGGDPTDFDKIALEKQERELKYAELKQKAVEWTTKQQMDLAKEGWQEIAKFPGGNPADFNAINIPGVGQYFRPVSAEDKAKQLIAETKVKAFKGMTPEQQAQYALEGPQKEGAYQTPTWGQKQLVESIRSALKAGTYTYKNQMLGGKPTKMPIKTIDDAIGLISMHQLDPTLFKNELGVFEQNTTSQGNTPSQDVDNIYNNM